MNRVELLEAASMHLAEAVILLAQAGEKRLAADAGELAEIVEFRTLPFEGQSVDNGSGDDLSCAGTTSKHIKPADYHDRQTDHGHEAFPMPNQCGIPKQHLGTPGQTISKKHGKIAEAIQDRVLRCDRQARRLLKENLDLRVAQTTR